MKQLEKGMFARSLAGHDKGKLYIIIEADEEFVSVSDGRLRPLEKLKRKRRRHVQPGYEISGVLAARMREGLPLRNEDIRKAIKVKEV